MARNISFRTVYYNGAEISYQLERKNVKNLNMRVKYDGAVYVSANRTVSVSRVDEFVISKGQFILDALQRFSLLRAAEPAELKYEENDVLCLLGQSLRLKLMQDEQRYVEYDREFIYLHVTDINDLCEKQRVYQKFTDSLCLSVFQRLMDDIYPTFHVFGIEMPRLRTRSMRSRWGTCHVSKKLVTLNKKLIEHPEGCIEYVIVHEFCHFIHANHSKQFYALLSRLMPDWKERRTELNQRRSVTDA